MLQCMSIWFCFFVKNMCKWCIYIYTYKICIYILYIHNANPMHFLQVYPNEMGVKGWPLVLPTPLLCVLGYPQCTGEGLASIPTKLERHHRTGRQTEVYIYLYTFNTSSLTLYHFGSIYKPHGHFRGGGMTCPQVST